MLFISLSTDLREDKYYLTDHPGMVPVTTVQVLFPLVLCWTSLCVILYLSIYIYIFAMILDARERNSVSRLVLHII